MPLIGKITLKDYFKRQGNFQKFSNVRTLVIQENLTNQRTVAQLIKNSVSALDNIINTSLNMKKKKNVHQLFLNYTSERKTLCIYICNKYLTVDKLKKTALPLSTVWMYLN